MTRRERAFVGLGSNLEDPARQVAVAIARLGELPDTCVSAASRLYRTPPWGEIVQPEFVNAVVELSTGLGPRELLAGLQRIEEAAGRRRERRWGPRVLDLDLLLYGSFIIEDADMHVPHPQLDQRAFVLVPLAELAPALDVPGRGRVDALLRGVDCTAIHALA